MCHAAAKNFGGLMAARFFLGVGEAAIAPGFSLITGMFYKREEQPARYASPITLIFNINIQTNNNKAIGLVPRKLHFHRHRRCRSLRHRQHQNQRRI